jgi:hypothetical protein
MCTSLRTKRLAVAFALVLCGCTAVSSSEPDPASGSLPTHTQEVGDAGTDGDAVRKARLLVARKQGNAAAGARVSRGYTAAREGGDVVLFDEQGRKIARTGERVSVGGQAADGGFSSCLHTSEAADNPWLASSVEPCPDDDCGIDPCPR